MNCSPGSLSNLGYSLYAYIRECWHLLDFCIAHCLFGMTGIVNVSGSCGQSGWSAGPDMPTVLVRAVGVYFQANGNFYTMGGRTSDLAGSDFQHAFEYAPGSNSWTQKASTFPDNQMNNMACGVLSVSGTPSIYCVGGSAAGGGYSYRPRILLQPGDRYCGHLDRGRLARRHGNNSARWFCSGSQQAVHLRRVQHQRCFHEPDLGV